MNSTLCLLHSESICMNSALLFIRTERKKEKKKERKKEKKKKKNKEEET